MGNRLYKEAAVRTDVIHTLINYYQCVSESVSISHKTQRAGRDGAKSCVYLFLSKYNQIECRKFYYVTMNILAIISQSSTWFCLYFAALPPSSPKPVACTLLCIRLCLLVLTANYQCNSDNFLHIPSSCSASVHCLCCVVSFGCRSSCSSSFPRHF